MHKWQMVSRSNTYDSHIWEYIRKTMLFSEGTVAGVCMVSKAFSKIWFFFLILLTHFYKFLSIEWIACISLRESNKGVKEGKVESVSVWKKMIIATEMQSAKGRRMSQTELS